MPRTRTILAAPVALTLAASVLGAPQSASADSIAYVRGGDVWLTTPDGARQVRVTVDGGYSTVSQSDLGRLVALHGDRIRTLERDGTVLHDVRTPHSSSTPGTRFRGPFDPSVSPDGLRIAYSWYFTQTGETGNCNPSTGCQTVYGRQGTNYISPDGTSPYDRPGFQEQTGWVGPSWNDSGETLLSDPIQVGNPDVVVHTPGSSAGGGVPGAMSSWFHDRTAVGGLSDGEMDPTRTKLAFVTGDAHEALFLYRARGGHPTVPQNCYRLDGGRGRLSSPTWSPDGRSLAYADADGLQLLPLPSFASDCGTPGPEHVARLLAPGASSPDWGPADVPVASATPPVEAPASPATTGPATPSAPGSGVGAGPGVAPAVGRPPTADVPVRVPVTASVPRRAALTLLRPTTLQVALSRGLPVRLSGAHPGRVVVRAVVDGRPAGSARVRVGPGGSARTTMRLNSATRRRLRSRSSATVVLRVGAVRTTLVLRRRAGS